MSNEIKQQLTEPEFNHMIKIIDEKNKEIVKLSEQVYMLTNKLKDKSDNLSILQIFTFVISCILLVGVSL